MTPLTLHCPECGEHYWVEKTDESWAHCEYCGYEKFDQWTLDLQNEVKREQAECKRVLGYVPDYKEAKAKGFAK